MVLRAKANRMRKIGKKSQPLPNRTMLPGQRLVRHYISRFAIHSFVTLSLALPGFVYAQTTKIAPAEKTTSSSTTANDLRALEQEFRENALRADARYKNKEISFDTFVVEVDKVNNKPHIKAYIVYAADGVEAFSEIFLKPTQLATAMTLKPNDHIQITGLLKGRTISSKESVEIHGRVGTVVNGNGGGGSIKGGSVTQSWPVYTVDSASIRILETGEARAKKEADAAAKQEDRNQQLYAALAKGDFPTAQKALDAGIDPAVVSNIVDEIVGMDPQDTRYNPMVSAFDFLVKSKKIPVATLGSVMERITGVNGLARPRLFKVFVDVKAINFNAKMPTGDNFLLFILKDPLGIGVNATPSRTLRLFFGEEQYQIVKIIAESGQAKGAADFKDSYGKSAKDYFNDYHDLVVRVGSSAAPSSPVDKIKAAILAMN